MNDKKQLKIDGKIKNPCFDEKTKTDCPRRAVGCQNKCNLYKIYKTLKAVEDKQKKKNCDAVDMFFEYEVSKTKRINKERFKK